MTRQQLQQALEIAQSDADLPSGFAACDIFRGFALPEFEQVTVTIEQLATLVRWQAVCLDGSIDSEALNEIARCGRRKFQVLG